MERFDLSFRQPGIESEVSVLKELEFETDTAPSEYSAKTQIEPFP